jgi:hypothetical protein
MNEDALRAMVREAVARHLTTSGERHGDEHPLRFVAGDVSHYRYTLPKTDGPCLIEPTVHCNNCGYCESHGH